MNRPPETESDSEAIVTAYRRAVAQLEDPLNTVPQREEFRAIVDRLRQRWKEWQGEDNLHEMAFGEAEE